LKINKKIEKQIKLLAKYSELQRKYDKELRKIFFENNVLNDGVIDQMIDSLMLTNDPEYFIDYFKQMDCDEGNTYDSF
jgi:hypothetical protein